MSDALSRSDRAGIVSEPSSQTNRIRPMERSDIPAVVRVHLSSFQGFFLSSLGERFLVVLYDRVLQLPDSIGFIAENASSSVVGFVIGVTSQAGLRRQLLVRYWPAFVRILDRSRPETPRNRASLAADVTPSGRGAAGCSRLFARFDRGTARQPGRARRGRSDERFSPGGP